MNKKSYIFEYKEIKDITYKAFGNMEIFKSIELFAGAGAGGMALGLENSGFSNSLLVEIDKNCYNTLKKNKPLWNVVNKDISEINFKEWRGKISLVSGGFPCQSFSQSGKRRGFEDERGTLFFQFKRCIKEIQPPIFIGENVEGLKTHDNGKTLKKIIFNLEKIGYIVKHKVLNCADYGIPQKRKRLILIGLRKDLKKWDLQFPKITHSNPITLRDALKNVPISDGLTYKEYKKK